MFDIIIAVFMVIGCIASFASLFYIYKGDWAAIATCIKWSLQVNFGRRWMAGFNVLTTVGCVVAFDYFDMEWSYWVTISLTAFSAVVAGSALLTKTEV